MRNSFLAATAAVALLVGTTGVASAAPLSVFVSAPTGSLATAKAAAAAWYAGTGAVTFLAEDFESFTAGARAMAFDTNVGTFTASNPGQYTGGLGIAPTIFSGRFNTTAGGSKWLDSYDYRTVTWSVDSGGAAFSHIGFFLTDVNDVAARLTLSATGEEMTVSFSELIQTFTAPLPNGRVFFVGLTLGAGVELNNLVFSTGSVRNDGWGIDDITIASVAEPATLGLLGLGLLAVVAARRRRLAR